MAGYIGSKSGTLLSNAAERKQTYSITTSTTSLTGLAYTPTKVHVFHNGVRLVDGTDYTATNGTSITLTNAAQNGDEVVVISYPSFQVSDTVSAANGGTFAGNVAMSGTLGVTGATTLSSTLGVTGKITSTAGITFGSDTSADNVLSDYEEGTWTPTLDFNTGASSVAYSERKGTYTKVGRLVTVMGVIVLTSKGSGGSGRVQITGLPFNCSTATGSNQYSGTVEARFVTLSSEAIHAEIGRSANNMVRIMRSQSGAQVAEITEANCANNTGFLFTITYEEA